MTEGLQMQRSKAVSFYNWHELETKEVLEKLGTGINGLTEKEASARLGRFGTNELREERKISRLKIFLNQFRSVLVLILIGATIFSALIGEMLDAGVIMIIVVLNAVFGFVQEYKAEKAIEALKKLSSPEAVVIREGKRKNILSRFLVPGDLVLLEQGRKVPADLRLVEVSDLQIDEAIITGESSPVTKKTELLKATAIAERKNMAWMDTIVTYGRGKGVVVETGMRTEIGKIAHLVQEAKEEETPLQKKLGVFGKNLGVIILIVCSVVVLAGIIRGSPIVSMIITGIALAVATVPEGLPAVVTITLALGLQRLSRSNAIIRKLPAVETLGSTTVICVDKTGTLTKNEMTVRKIWYEGRTVEVTGEGYEPSGKFLVNKTEIKPEKDQTLMLILRTGMLCNNAELEKSGNGWSITGDPTEGSLIVVAEKSGLSHKDVKTKYPRVREITFTSERKMMSVLNRTPEKKIIVSVKGAVEKILGLCENVYREGRMRKMTEKEKKEILKANHVLTGEALRVLAVGYKEIKTEKIETEKVESNLCFLGLVGMTDPPREGVSEDIALCKKAGIKVVMITGDHKNTAMAIAKELKITEGDGKLLTGEELDKISDKELERIVEQVAVYARVDPIHKVRIVDAFKKRGNIIAMTGDGVNDAPAIKKADIGISMGIKGTDVAREASDMVLTDDNFLSIVAAIKGGRQIYDNIKKFIQYLLSSNLGEVLIIFVAMLIGFSDPHTGRLILPLTAIQLLWINLLTDGLPALALGVDPPAKNVMERPPRDPKEKILSKDMFIDMVIVGIIICIGTLVLFAYNLPTGGLKAMTVAFTTVVVFEMVRVQSVRMRYKLGIFSNRKLILAIASSILLQIMIIYIPIFQPAFDTMPLDLMDWVEIGLVSSSVMVVIFLKEKIFRRPAITFSKNPYRVDGIY